LGKPNWPKYICIKQKLLLSKGRDIFRPALPWDLNKGDFDKQDERPKA
jgi:hypothetical protein